MRGWLRDERGRRVPHAVRDERGGTQHQAEQEQRPQVVGEERGGAGVLARPQRWRDVVAIEVGRAFSFLSSPPSAP